MLEGPPSLHEECVQQWYLHDYTSIRDIIIGVCVVNDMAQSISIDYKLHNLVVTWEMVC